MLYAFMLFPEVELLYISSFFDRARARERNSFRTSALVSVPIEIFKLYKV